MGESKSQCDTCFWRSIAGWCTKGTFPVVNYEPVFNCPEYTARTYDYGERTSSGLLEE